MLELNQKQQKEFINLLNLYNKTDSNIIRYNLTKHIKQQRVKAETIAIKTTLNINTIYAITKTENKYKPDFLTSLLLCDFLKVDITEIVIDH
jgi:hypothetical protein